MIHVNNRGNNGWEFPWVYLPGNQTEPAFTAEVTAHGGIDLLDANPAWFQLMQRCSEPSASAAGDEAGKDRASQQFFQQLRENFQDNDAYTLSSWIPIIVGGRSLLAQITPICDVESHIVRLMGSVRDITDKADSEAERLSNLCFFKSMDRINRTIQQASDLKQMMSDVLDLVLDIFNCDRAFLLHPCNPDAATWQVPMERTRPAYPGAMALGLEIDMTPEVAASLQHILASDGPIQFGPETTRIIPPEVEKQFQLKSFMAMVIHPKVGEPWQFGIHQCSSVRKWNASEERLLKEIGLRLSDGLTSMLILRNLKESEGKLKEAELQFHTLFDNLPDCIARFDRDGRVLLLNQTSLKTFNLNAEEAVGTLLNTTGPSSDPENAKLTALIRRAFDEGIANRSETEWQTGEGRRSFSVLHIPEKDEHDRVVSVIGIAHDITDQKIAEEELRHSEERYRLIVDTASEGVWVVDSDNITTFVNSSMAEMLGYSVQEMLGRKMSDFLFAEDMQSHQEIESILHHGETDISERRLRRIDGKNLWTLASASPILSREQGYKGSITLFTDITQRRLQQEQLLYQAHYDALTGLPNRFLALDRLQQNINLAARKGETTALLFLDLDDFKKINDALGHEVGDQVLRMAATRLEQTIRSSDTVARLGGDEFVVLIQENADAEAIRPVAEKILETFQEIFLVMNRQVMLTASMGISIYPDHGDKPLLLLRNADTAMYHSKAMGGNTFHYFTESMNRHVAHRLQMEEQLRMALQRNELYIEYQPMVELSSDKIIGVEALLRWHNEILGQVSTTEFVEIAEQTGMIITIGEWVIDTALTYLKHWERWIDEDFRMALNVSPRQFRKVDFVDLLGRAMKRAGVTGNQIELEITEGMLLGDEVGAAQIITKLHELGVSISMDDFGTGYSSLSYLRDYRFDTLKIDRVFVRDIIEDPSDRELIIATLRMAKGLGVRVVAEGVESAEQLEFLRQEGCDFVQGWYFSKSVSPDDFAEMLQHKRHLP